MELGGVFAALVLSALASLDSEAATWLCIFHFYFVFFFGFCFVFSKVHLVRSWPIFANNNIMAQNLNWFIAVFRFFFRACWKPYMVFLADDCKLTKVRVRLKCKRFQ